MHLAGEADLACPNAAWTTAGRGRGKAAERPAPGEPPLRAMRMGALSARALPVFIPLLTSSAELGRVLRGEILPVRPVDTKWTSSGESICPCGIYTDLRVLDDLSFVVT